MSAPTTYGSLLAAWRTANGTAVAVIAKGSYDWAAWRAYYVRYHVPWALELMDGRVTWTVPAPHPSTFDPRFVG